MLNSIKDRISDLYKEHIYILGSKKLIVYDEKNFEMIVKGTKTRSTLINSLSSLARYLYTYFDVNPIILIDEYDWPMEHAGKFYEEANSFFQSMYSSVAKVSYFFIVRWVHTYLSG